MLCLIFYKIIYSYLLNGIHIEYLRLCLVQFDQSNVFRVTYSRLTISKAIYLILTMKQGLSFRTAAHQARQTSIPPHVADEIFHTFCYRRKSSVRVITSRQKLQQSPAVAIYLVIPFCHYSRKQIRPVASPALRSTTSFNNTLYTNPQ